MATLHSMNNSFLFFILMFISHSVFSASPDKGLGINLYQHKDWSPSLSFIDIMKKSRTWFSQRSTDWEWDTGETIHLTQDGWVASLDTHKNQEVATIINPDLKGRYPAGMYTCFYKGEGEFSFEGDATLLSHDNKNKQCHVEVTPSDTGIIFKITKVNPENPIREIQLILPSFAKHRNTQVFTPTLIQSLRKYQSVRFMDWNQTNNSPVTTWLSRTHPGDAIQTSKSGVAYEHIIDLANAAQINPWINVPHMADDNHVSQLAILIRDRLDPHLKVYIEYSNETWNGQFQQHHYLKKLATAKGYHSSEGWKIHSERSVEIFKLFTSVFGNNKRIIRVLAGFHEIPWLNEQILSWNNAYQYADALAIAPYFGTSVTAEASLKDKFAQLNGDMDRVFEKIIPENLQVAKKYHLPLIAYEAGQHITALNTKNKAACKEVNNDERMEEVYSHYLNHWRESTSNSLMVLWNQIDKYSIHGCWGLREFPDEPPESAPKYRAVIHYIEKHNATLKQQSSLP